mgnify:CR=1 FL=1
MLVSSANKLGSKNFVWGIELLKYIIKSVGPKIERWGNPHVMLCETDLTKSIWTHRSLFSRSTMKPQSH